MHIPVGGIWKIHGGVPSEKGLEGWSVKAGGCPDKTKEGLTWTGHPGMLQERRMFKTPQPRDPFVILLWVRKLPV